MWQSEDGGDVSSCLAFHGSSFVLINLELSLLLVSNGKDRLVVLNKVQMGYFWMSISAAMGCQTEESSQLSWR